MNIYDYIEKYKDVTFSDKEFNEVDNLVFSLLVYLDYSHIFFEDSTIYELGDLFLSMYNLSDIKTYGIPQRDAYICLEKIFNTTRYKDIRVKDYCYITSHEEQFSAMEFCISKDLSYIAYEGTDHLVSGWKEDFEMSYKFPVPSQVRAVEYLNHNVKLFGPNVIVGGHSKGGNLALIAAMYLKWYKKGKIIKIYSNDGPGLRKKQFLSNEYRSISKKLIHIVPSNSVVGILMRNDIYKSIKSNKKSIYAHSISSWMIEDDKLIDKDLEVRSRDLETRIIKWLDHHDDEKRERLITNIFKVFDKCGISDLREAKKFFGFIKLIREVRNIDKETKDLVLEFVSYTILRNKL